MWLPHFHSAATQSLYFCFIHIWMTLFFTFSIPTFSGKLRQDLVSVSHPYYPTYYKSSNVHISAKHFLQVAKEASKIWIHIFQCIEKAYKTSYRFGSTTVQDGGSPACSLLFSFKVYKLSVFIKELEIRQSVNIAYCKKLFSKNALIKVQQCLKSGRVFLK